MATTAPDPTNTSPETASISETLTSLLSETLSETLTSLDTTSSITSESTTAAQQTTAAPQNGGLDDNYAAKSQGITLVAFLTALTSALVIFGAQIGIFFLLRNKLARIFKPKTYLVPERERTDPPPQSPWGMVSRLLRYKDREVIEKCGLDAYFFLRYLQTMLVIFIPMTIVIIPILVPLNFSDGKGQSLLNETLFSGEEDLGTADESLANVTVSNVTGLDTLAWGNIKPANSGRYTAHLVLAIMVIIWVCGVFFAELRVYIKVRQDYLTTAEHRLRASATTVLVNSIPKKWLSEKALVGLFDVFPGGIRNVWLTRDMTELLEKIHKRDAIHLQLEAAETELIRMTKRKQLKRRAKDEKKAQKESKQRTMSKGERERRQQLEDESALRLARSGGGISSGDHEVPQDVAGAVEECQYEEEERERVRRESSHHIPSLASLGRGLKNGIGMAKANEGVTPTVDKHGDLTRGFMNIGGSRDLRPSSAASERLRSALPGDPDSPVGENPRRRHGHTLSTVSQDTAGQLDGRGFGNTVRAVTNIQEMYVFDRARWYQFWKVPSGGYASPIPQACEGDEFPLTGNMKPPPRTLWQRINPFHRDELVTPEYLVHTNFDDPAQHETSPEWEKWIKKSARPAHRLPIFQWTPNWLPGLPFINKKVDTIYWCRKELARLNMEVEQDQKNPDRYPLMNSAFIQFNHQVGAHMACQSVTHHVPQHMAPRDIEISPNDVIWDNMAVTWWQEWIRTSIVLGVVTGMIILWAIPVAWSATLSNIDALIEAVPWLDFLAKDKTVYNAVKAAAGVLPALFLAILLLIVPFIFDLLAHLKGCKTGAQKAETVQSYFFVFLFVQVFLIVSITSGALQTIKDFTADVGQGVADIPTLLAENLPKAANYFFSYMILQALSTSSGTLLQIGTLFIWYIIAKMWDNTARSKWTRNTTLPTVIWGAFFPVYTNFACIALIYSVVAPIISIFAIITFSLLWIAHRYNMLYVTRFENDTGGVLYPRAINQTFTGLYVMELCLIGLFFLVRDENGDSACTAHAITMIVMLCLTILYQYLLNRSFAPLFRYLPITFEDEAVLRDEAFQRAQDQRLGLLSDDSDADEPKKHLGGDGHTEDANGIELQQVGNGNNGHHSLSVLAHGKLNPVRGIMHASTWAAKGSKHVADMTFGRAESNYKSAATYRRTRRKQDLEAQRAIGDALYGGYHDEIEDLTPEERDLLVRHAFQHYALRSRRPVVWIPRDDIGVADDEIKRTKEFSEFVWISNEGTALDSKTRVVYGRNPPDFSEVDLINL